MVIENSFEEIENPNYGVSFSKKYAEELGVDWQKNYLALLDDMKFKNFRLMSYWDDIEIKKGTYNFADLDWQMDQAEKRGANVSLAIGLRQPRWPECHKPSWYKNLTSQTEKDQAVSEFISKTVNRYKSHPALVSYQLENEALNRHFGNCDKSDMNRDRLIKQFNLVKKLDKNNPVYMSLSDQHGLPINKPVPDKYGFSVYRVVYNNKFGPFKTYVTYPTPVWYHKLRALWINTFRDRSIFVHELQVEPWGPKRTKDLSIKQQNDSMSNNQIKQNIKFARKIGLKDIDLWGGEWWYWRKSVLNDPSVWNTVKRELNQ